MTGHRDEELVLNPMLGGNKDYIPRKFTFPDTNKEAIVTALQNLQVAINSRKKKKSETVPKEESRGLKYTENLNDIKELWNRLKDSEERCAALSDEMRCMKSNAPLHGMRANAPDDKNEDIRYLRLDDIKLLLAKNMTENKLEALRNLEADAQESCYYPTTSTPNSSKKWRKMNHDQDEVIPSVSSTTAVLPTDSSQTSIFRQLTEIPFVTGKSTGQSYSLSANIQEVISLIKSRGSKTCKVPNRTPQRSCQCKKMKPLDSPSIHSNHRHCYDSDYEHDNSLKELVSQIYDEYQHTRTEYKQTLGGQDNRRDDQNKQRLKLRQELREDQELPTTRSEINTKISSIRGCRPGKRKSRTKASPNRSDISCQHSKNQRGMELLQHLREIQFAMR